MEPRWQLAKFLKLPDPRPFWVKAGPPLKDQTRRLYTEGVKAPTPGELVNTGNYQTNVLDPVRLDGSCLRCEASDVELLGGGYADVFLLFDEDPPPDGRLIRQASNGIAYNPKSKS